MKKFIFVIFSFMFLGLFLNSCDILPPDPPVDHTLRLGQMRSNLKGDSLTIETYDQHIDTFQLRINNNFTHVSTEHHRKAFWAQLQLEFAVPEGEELTTGTYYPNDNCAFNNSGNNEEVCIRMSFKLGILWWPTIEPYYSTNSDLYIEVTEVDFRSGGFIKGTFEGILLDDKSTTLTISNGEFYLPIK